MREKEFRAWQKDNGFGKSQMLYDIKILNVLINTNREDNLEFMEYIGIKDNKGKKIYEGDIVKIDDLQIMEITYHNLEFIFSDDYFYRSINNVTTIEVIGNIYENPKLKEKK